MNPGGGITELQSLADPGLRAFFPIAKAWHLTIDEQVSLLDLGARSTLYKWRSKPTTRLGRDRLERLSHVLGNYTALGLLFPNQDAADSRVRKPNWAPLLNETSALQLMVRGGTPGLLAVRQYLEAHRGYPKTVRRYLAQPILNLVLASLEGGSKSGS